MILPNKAIEKSAKSKLSVSHLPAKTMDKFPGPSFHQQHRQLVCDQLHSPPVQRVEN